MACVPIQASSCRGSFKKSLLLINFSEMNSQEAGAAPWRVGSLCLQVPEKRPFISCGCCSVCFKSCSAPALSWRGVCGTTDVTKIPLNLGGGRYLKLIDGASPPSNDLSEYGSDESVRKVAEWVKVSHKGSGFFSHLTQIAISCKLTTAPFCLQWFVGQRSRAQRKSSHPAGRSRLSSGGRILQAQL